VADEYETEQRELDPHRAEEQRKAREEAESRLRARGIEVLRADDDEAVADLLDAIERFESAVESRGGDLFVNRIGSAEPEAPEFIPPIRQHGERAGEYRERIDRAASRLRRA
jgi:hypothetical protein